MNKILIGLLVLAVVGFGALNVLSSEDSPTDKTLENEQNTIQISRSEVAMHGSETDCWTYVGDTVYDITEYVPRHPGGDTILLACGGDGTTLFEQRKTENGEKVGSGLPHSAGATSQLSAYAIGDLVE